MPTQLSFEMYLEQQQNQVHGHRNFDSPRARLARDVAIAQADEHAVAEWKTAARACIEHCARTLPEFTTDDVFKRLIQYRVITRDNRAIGPQMIQAAANGLIAKTDRHIKTERVSRHNTEIAVWRSLIYSAPSN